MIKNYLGIIPRNLTKNRKRTMVLVASILFMITLITSGEILVRSVVNSAVERAGMTSGWYHGGYTFVRHENIKRLREDSRVDRLGILVYIGTCSMEEYGISVNTIEDEASKLLNVNIIEGDFPRGEGEIVMEKWVMDKLYPGKKIGDKIPMNIVVTRFKREFERELLTEEFLISGIVQNSAGSVSLGEGKAYFTMETASRFVSPNEMVYNLYFTLKDGEDIVGAAESFNQAYEENKIGHYMYNRFYLTALDNVSKSGTVVIFLDIVVSLAAAIMIHNIFNISIHERVKQFGLLKSIGITPSQIMVIILGEALLLGFVLVPAGIFLGVNITKILFGIIGGLGENRMVVDSKSYNIALISLTGVFAIIIASLKPAKLAAGISPIQAISMTGNIFRHEVKNETFLEGLARRALGQTWKMAYSNLARNRKRFLTTTVSIMMGSMLFIGISYFIGSLNPVRGMKEKMNSNFLLTTTENYSDTGYQLRDLEEIRDIQGIAGVYEHRVLWVNINLKAENFTREQRDEYDKTNQYAEWYRDYMNKGVYLVRGYLVGCDSETYSSILKDSNIKTDDKRNLPGVIIVEKIRNIRETSLKPGDIIKVEWSKKDFPQWQQYEREFIVEAVVERSPFKFDVDKGSAGIITENSIIGEQFELENFQVLEINTKRHANENEVEGRLKEVVDRQKAGKLISYTSDLERYRKTVFQTAAVLYMLFGVAAIIVIVNIINTISMNILTRGREFGMLRAIGMTKNQLRGMILKEGIIYGITGSLGGAILGIGFCALIYRGLILQINYYDNFRIDYAGIIITFAATILLTMGATIIPLKRAVKLDVMESIRAIE